MKVAFLIYLEDSFGGAERRIIRVYNEMCSKNERIECDLLVRGCEQKNVINILNQSDCEVSNLRDVKCFSNQIQCLKYLWKTNDYDVIHFFCAGNFNIMAQIIMKIKEKKNIYSICSYFEALQILPVKHKLKVMLQIKLADVVDLLNPLGQYKLCNKKNSKKIFITPGTFTDLNIFKPQNKEKLMVFAAARLENAKNPELLVEACRLAQNKIRENKYLICILGKGELENSLNDKINSYQIKDIVELKGYGRTSEYLPKAEAFFSLQKIENYPSQSLAEAIASGCYAFITDVGDSRRCANSEFASFVKDDAKDLAQEIEKFIDKDIGDKKNIICKAREYACQHYTIIESEYYFNNLLNIIEDM